MDYIMKLLFYCIHDCAQYNNMTILLVWFVYIVDGKWSEWIDITECAVTCGEGTKVQSRSCSEPPSSCGGMHCVGDDIRKVPCNISSCCPGLYTTTSLLV